MKKPSVPKCLEGLRKSSGKLYSSLAVFYVEQVALNRHVLSAIAQRSTRRNRSYVFLCLKTQEMSRAKSEAGRGHGKVCNNSSGVCRV